MNKVSKVANRKRHEKNLLLHPSCDTTCPQFPSTIELSSDPFLMKQFTDMLFFIRLCLNDAKIKLKIGELICGAFEECMYRIEKQVYPSLIADLAIGPVMNDSMTQRMIVLKNNIQNDVKQDLSYIEQLQFNCIFNVDVQSQTPLHCMSIIIHNVSMFISPTNIMYLKLQMTQGIENQWYTFDCIQSKQ